VAIITCKSDFFPCTNMSCFKLMPPGGVTGAAKRISRSRRSKWWRWTERTGACLCRSCCCQLSPLVYASTPTTNPSVRPHRSPSAPCRVAQPQQWRPRWGRRQLLLPPCLHRRPAITASTPPSPMMMSRLLPRIRRPRE